MLYTRLCFAGSIILALLSQGAEAGPEGDLLGAKSMVERFVELNNAGQLQTAEGRALLSGEMASFNQPTGGHLPLPDKIAVLPDGTIVARIPGEQSKRPDIYFNLHQGHDATWSIEAYRVLAIPALFPMEIDKLRKQSSRTPDEELMIRQFDTALSTDEILRVWFNQNRSALEQLKRIGSSSSSAPGAEQWEIQTPEGEAILRQIGGMSATQTASGATVVTIAGIIDNSVGFIWTLGTVPTITNGDYIWLESVGTGWHLFKTS